MKWGRLILLAAALAAPVAGATGLGLPAQQVTVRKVPTAPDRLLLDHWPTRGWQLRVEGRQVELAFPGLALAVAIPIEPVLPGTISGLTTGQRADASYLAFRLECDCAVAVQGDGDVLVIDVVRRRAVAPPPEDAGAAAPVSAPAPPTRQAAGNDADRPARDRADRTRARLLDELRQAAESGLITLRDVPGAPNELATEQGAALAVAGIASPISPISPPGHAPVPPDVPGATDPPRLMERSDLDPATTETESPRHDTANAGLTARPADKPTCLASEAFRLPDPLPRADFVRTLGEMRGRLAGEFDRADPEAVINLARMYLGHGMGVEAAALLVELDVDTAEAQLLAGLAPLVEGRPAEMPSQLAADGCSGQHALWQAVDAALRGSPTRAIALEAAAAGALEQTGRGVRGLIAVRLGLAVVTAGDLAAAERLRAMAQRMAGQLDAESAQLLSLLEARLALASGRNAEAEALLARLDDPRSEAGAEAYLLRAEMFGDEGGSEGTGDSLRHVIGSLATEHRGTPLGSRAFLAEARLVGGVFGREAAFAFLLRGAADGVLTSEALDRALADMATRLPARADDRPLALAFEAAPDRFAGALADAAFREALARSYVELGAPRLAESMLATDDLIEPGLRADLAKGHAAAGEMEAAARLASSLPSGPERAAIEAAIARAAGDNRAWHGKLAMAAAPPTERARAAWAAGDWPASLAALTETAAAQSSRGVGGSALDRAARIALAALATGAETAPEASTTNVEGAGEQRAIEALFIAPPGPGADLPDLGGYLDALTAEIGLWKEILDDG